MKIFKIKGDKMKNLTLLELQDIRFALSLRINELKHHKKLFKKLNNEKIVKELENEIKRIKKLYRKIKKM
jgi:hypothetical protein